MRSAVIVDAIRTPSGKGKPGGQLSAMHPTELLALTLTALVERTGLDPALIDDVITGCVHQAREQASNIGRNAVLAAAFPESVPATTVDRQCGSSQQAIHFAAQAVMSGSCDVTVACGVESMSRVPMGMPAMGHDPFGPAVADRYAPGLVHQGIGAELIASRWGLTRHDLDEFSARSHELATEAESSGAFERELIQVEADGLDGAAVKAVRDETIRPTTNVGDLGNLPPAFRDDVFSRRFPEINWHITAGNSSPLTDGASALLILEEQRAVELGLTPRARIHSLAVVGDDPIMMLTAPIPATKKILARAGLGIEDIDAFEVNEAFAPIPLAWQHDVGANPDRVNVRGGAIALGHPLGASGARLMTTLLHILEDHGWRYGLQTMCEGGGMANATIIERI